eukprot:1066781-Rhodomonas_salina.1
MPQTLAAHQGSSTGIRAHDWAQSPNGWLDGSVHRPAAQVNDQELPRLLIPPQLSTTLNTRPQA